MSPSGYRSVSHSRARPPVSGALREQYRVPRSNFHSIIGSPHPNAIPNYSHPKSKSGERTPRAHSPVDDLLQAYRRSAGLESVVGTSNSYYFAPFDDDDTFESRFDPSFLASLRAAVEKDDAKWVAKTNLRWKEWDQQADPSKSWAEVVSQSYTDRQEKQRNDEITPGDEWEAK